MRPEEIPEFIYRGAVVSVDGREQTVKEFSLQTPLGAPAKRGPCLYLEFASGLALEYNDVRVKEIPDRAPDFMRVGGHLFIKDPPSKNPNEERFRKAGNGEWEITHFHFEKDDDGEQKIRVVLKRPWVPGNKGVLSRHFNPRTMTPVGDDFAAPAPLVPVYELQNDISVKKPIVLKRPA